MSTCENGQRFSPITACHHHKRKVMYNVLRGVPVVHHENAIWVYLARPAVSHVRSWGNPLGPDPPLAGSQIAPEGLAATENAGLRRPQQPVASLWLSSRQSLTHSRATVTKARGSVTALLPTSVAGRTTCVHEPPLSQQLFPWAGRLWRRAPLELLPFL